VELQKLNKRSERGAWWFVFRLTSRGRSVVQAQAQLLFNLAGVNR